METRAESEFFRSHFFEIPIVLFQKGLKTVSMMNEHGGDSEHFVTFENGGWRFGDLSGSVAASIPIRRHRKFCEVAVLVSSELPALSYAARVAHTEHWLHFDRLHAWMFPIVEELLGIQEKHSQIAELVNEIHRLAEARSSR